MPRFLTAPETTTHDCTTCSGGSPCGDCDNRMIAKVLHECIKERQADIERAQAQIRRARRGIRRCQRILDMIETT